LLAGACASRVQPRWTVSVPVTLLSRGVASVGETLAVLITLVPGLAATCTSTT
jgi:hypothetical protein